MCLFSDIKCFIICLLCAFDCVVNTNNFYLLLHSSSPSSVCSYRLFIFIIISSLHPFVWFTFHILRGKPYIYIKSLFLGLKTSDLKPKIYIQSTQTFFSDINVGVIPCNEILLSLKNKLLFSCLIFISRFLRSINYRKSMKFYEIFATIISN